MNQDEIIEMARQHNIPVELAAHPAVKKLVHEVSKQIKARYMQLFLDPENQPTQFGTATQEYRDAEKSELLKRLEIAKEVWRKDNELLLVFKEIAHIVRTTHLYGPEMKKLLEKEEAIRARGEA